MAIILKAPAKLTNFDVYLELRFLRNRKDIATLLQRLNKGETLKDVFHNEVVENSVKNFLIEKDYLGENGTVSTNGLKFIDNPYFLEIEEGVFSVDAVFVEILGSKYSFITKMTRKLKEDKRDASDFSLSTLTFGNTFQLENEEYIINYIDNKSKKVFVGSTKDVAIDFDIANGKYFIENIQGNLGQDICKALQPLAKETIQTNAPDFFYDEEERHVWLNNINVLTDEEILNGVLNRHVANVQFKSEPYQIKQTNAAVAYAYNYAYCLLDKGKFLSTDDLNDIFVNEILSGKNIHESIKDGLLSFKYSLDEFESKLSSEKYQKLDYRLRVVKELLDIEAITTSDKSFAALRSYGEVTSFVTNKVNPVEVDELYLVMGYAFVDNKKNKNRIVECLKSLQTAYDNITIVDKAPNQDNVNLDILNEVKNLGVKVTNKPVISNFFHDRYFIFKLINGSYKVYLCSSEIGQLFGYDRHVKGSFVEQKVQDVTMKERNLIEIAVGK